jgi:aspartyl/glutamyl-tRNA(Asn/Gln) amidotransferase C subunit
MNIEDVSKLAELARIELSEEEKKSLLEDMQGILEYVKQIEETEVPTNEVVGTPTASSGAYNVWREDKITPREFSSEIITEQFPDSQPARLDDTSRSGGDGIFLKVKKIL